MISTVNWRKPPGTQPLNGTPNVTRIGPFRQQKHPNDFSIRILADLDALGSQFRSLTESTLNGRVTRLSRAPREQRVTSAKYAHTYKYPKRDDY